MPNFVPFSKEWSFSGGFKIAVNKDIFRRRERKQWLDGENNVIKRSFLFRKRETNYEISVLLEKQKKWFRFTRYICFEK